jgi:signal transduction histidine kinase/HAMP domain-containing protein
LRNKLIYSLFSLFALFFLGAVISMLYMYRTTEHLKSVIALHRVEIIRQDLVISAQTVQSNLYTFGTVFGPELDVIVNNVIDLGDAANRCLDCHHSQEMTERLHEVNGIVEQYKDALSYLITTSANPDRLERLRSVAINIGGTLLSKTQEMAVIAGERLNTMSIDAIQEIENSRIILIVTLVLSFFIALAIAITMTRQITEPIYELVDATRKIKSGELGYTTSFTAPGEFGELIESFNDMSSSLKVSNETIMQNLQNLSNLYSTTLTFHAITNKSDICREVAYGVAEIVGAEQCGLMLPEGDEFVHMSPAVGLDEEAITMLRIPVATIMDRYHNTKRRALVLNDDVDNSPTAGVDLQLGVKNLMYVWVRHKGDLIGAIRVANKKSGDFTEEDVNPLAILANNLSVALENSKLYEDLKKQMQELQNAQEQLIQAAKLVAIGELASNVAHEINNPLTSILGYAELIKEETDLNSIMKDVDVIESESLRARDIVHQLLEFSRKRPVEMKRIDINEILGEVIGLVQLQLKDTQITIREDFGDVPNTQGDPNQLKQVFLNLMNNAVFAMQNEGTLGVSTRAVAGSIHVAVTDTGRGIPQELLPRIFEPFFSTKQEKGTGIGLSVSYKIVQSHKGRLDVESKEGKGSTFTVVLPII